MSSIIEKLTETKQILDKEGAIKKLKSEGVQDIERTDGGIVTKVFISDEFLSQFADFIEFQNYVDGK
ncbi:MAG: hypothetical protein ABJG42_24570 [Vibrio splendidus]